MIVVSISLVSALGEDRDEELGLLILDNVTSVEKMAERRGQHCDYRCRAYRKGTLEKAGGDARRVVGKPIREAMVLDHTRHSLPVQTLVAKALKEMGYNV